MATLIENKNRIVQTFSNIKNSIIAKGVSVPSSDVSTYADRILLIPTTTVSTNIGLKPVSEDTWDGSIGLARRFSTTPSSPSGEVFYDPTVYVGDIPTSKVMYVTFRIENYCSLLDSSNRYYAYIQGVRIRNGVKTYFTDLTNSSTVCVYSDRIRVYSLFIDYQPYDKITLEFGYTGYAPTSTPTGEVAGSMSVLLVSSNV